MKTRHWLAVAALLSFGTLLVLGGVAYHFIFPKIYQAAARIKVDPGIDVVQRRFDAWSRDQPGSIHGYGGVWVTSEFERLQSKSILYQVVTDLALNRRWAEQRSERAPLTLDQTYPLLLERISVFQPRNSSVIFVQVLGYDSNEPAIIANKIVDVYRDSRNADRKETVAAFLQAMQKRQAAHDTEIQQLAEKSSSDPGVAARRELVRRRRESLQQRIDFETAEAAKDNPSWVQIIDQASPSPRPVRPNGVYGIGALMFGAFIDLAVLLWLTMGGRTGVGEQSAVSGS